MIKNPENCLKIYFFLIENGVDNWWKKMEPYVDGKVKISGNVTSATGKKCMPMLDAMTAGYIVPLWTDIMVTKNANGHSVSWKTKEPVFGVHDPRQSDGVAHPLGYSSSAFKYHNPWVIKTSSGWSSPAGGWRWPMSSRL